MVNKSVNSVISEELAEPRVVVRARRLANPFSHMPPEPLLWLQKQLDPERRLNLDALSLFSYALFAGKKMGFSCYFGNL